MKIILKIGDPIYDQLMFPNVKGEVVDIEKYLLVVKFNEKAYYYPYKANGPSNLNHFPPHLSTTPYQIIGLNPICQ